MWKPEASRATCVGLALALLAACSNPTPRPEPPRPEPPGRVALHDAAREADLTYLASDLTADQQEELRRDVPGLRVVVAHSPDEALRLAPQVRGAEARFATPQFLAEAKKLVWLQAMSAGVERLLAVPAIRDDDRIVLTNMKGSSAPAIADHAFAMLLALTRDLRVRLEPRADHRWSRANPGARTVALKDKTLLVVGLGSIGSEVAARAHGFGMRVVATRRSGPGGGDVPAWIEKVGRPEELDALLPTADVVAICVPLTKETDHLFDGEKLARTKRGAILINVARGRIVDTAALVEALQASQLAGACLDVTDPEPLPDDSPLWTMKNVVITPHVASDAEITDERSWALLKENLKHFAAGEPLKNVVDKKAGY
ncbi:MAG TPA: D-2-hydroxyacid dehydrogenase [Planctomycetota bacterium]|nr:D-2-hydroxyacid dehydrogenase [Planctomycetota bacterium]